MHAASSPTPSNRFDRKLNIRPGAGEVEAGARRDPAPLQRLARGA